MAEFKTIRETAATGLISEHYLRLMVKRGECPGIQNGTRFLINFEKLVEKLDRQSVAHLTGGEVSA